MNDDNAIIIPESQQTEIVDISTDNIFLMAEQAEKTIVALNKIMQAALKITTEMDWVLIGGKPYLQETGAAKVRALFGISWQINPEPQVETQPDGHRTYTYHGNFSFRNSSIDAEGSRSSKDDFFAGKGKTKSVDEIDMKNVRKAAYTNCINNGMKRILPGLRNIDVSALEAAGMDLSKIQGYTFKRGSQGGTPQDSTETGLTCSKCNAPISQKVASYSESKFGTSLCYDCQKVGA